MDMGSLLGNILDTILNYKEGPYVHLTLSLGKANSRSSSCANRKAFQKQPQGPLRHVTSQTAAPERDMATEAWLLGSQVGFRAYGSLPLPGAYIRFIKG